MISPSYPQYFYNKDNIRLFYTTNFKKDELKENERVLIFNYGLVCNVNHYQFQIPFFHKLGYKILYHDYRFHYSSGLTDNIKDLTFHNIVSDLKGILDQNNITNAAMIGHSMGVNITLEFAKQFPDILKSMILISGTVLPPQDVMFDTNAMGIATPFIKWFAKEHTPIFELIWKTQHLNPIARHFIFKGGFNTKYVNPEFVQVYMKKISELPHEVFLQLMEEMKNHDIVQHLEQIKTQALIMGGDHDQVIPNYLQNILKQNLPHSQLYIVKDGSHVPQADFPDSINDRIEIFLNNA